MINRQKVRTFGKQIQLKAGINIQEARNDGKQLQLKAGINKQRFRTLGHTNTFESRDQRTRGPEPW